jgi:hypothetical protein
MFRFASLIKDQVSMKPTKLSRNNKKIDIKIIYFFSSGVLIIFLKTFQLFAIESFLVICRNARRRWILNCHDGSKLLHCVRESLRQLLDRTPVSVVVTPARRTAAQRNASLYSNGATTL